MGRWNLSRFPSSPLITGFGRDMVAHNTRGGGWGQNIECIYSGGEIYYMATLKIKQPTSQQSFILFFCLITYKYSENYLLLLSFLYNAP